MEPKVSKIFERLNAHRVALQKIDPNNLEKRLQASERDFDSFKDEIENHLSQAVDVVMEMSREMEILEQIQDEAVDGIQKVDQLLKNAEDLGLDAGEMRRTLGKLEDIDSEAFGLIREIESQVSEYNSILR